MPKWILDLKVKDVKVLNHQYFQLLLTSSQTLPPMHPGQFVELRIDNAPNAFLRRPISINNFHQELNELLLLIQIVGPGTYRLSELNIGDTVNAILPLGNTFTLPTSKNTKSLLVGGGVGTAPMFFLAERLYGLGYACDILLGAKKRSMLVDMKQFLKLGEVFCTTEDGSLGEKGLVTDHFILKSNKYNNIYACGPTPMMKAVAQIAKSTQAFCEVSLENTMACGFGACLCCVVDTEEGNQCVCTEGPVFNIKHLKW